VRLSACLCSVADMALTFPLPEARDQLAELVTCARRGNERVVLIEKGEPVAVLISIDELDELQRAQDAADIARCEAIKARNEPGMPHEEFMAALDAEDQRQPAT
jgi:prevent-host-death family protein